MLSPETFARYAAMRVPRYTSYPTAPNFSAGISNADYRAWLRRLPPDEPISIYLHIPFCRQMCWYCGCHTSVARRMAPVSRYVSTLINEIRLVSAQLGTRRKAAHIHWGGGSPTLLAPADIDRIHRALSEAFVLDPTAERSVEIDPRTLSEPVVESFARAGVSRASVGVQSFDPAVQAAINRIQSFEVTAEAVTMLRAHSIPRINFDLIYGLPFQTVRSCMESAEQALKLQPDRLAVFGYAHVPHLKAHQRKIEESGLPSGPERQMQARAIAASLTGAGYRQIGLDHFALPGDDLAIAAEEGMLRRNFQGYTTDPCPVLIGFGASAIGRLAQGFVQNAVRIPDYERRIASGQLAVARGCPVSDEDSLRAAIIEQLMCNYRAYVGSVDAPLDQLESDGLIRRSGQWVAVTDEGRPLVRAIAAAFDAYLPTSTAQHVIAV